MAEPDELASRLAEQLAAALDDDPAYERHGVLETSPWGSGRWVKFTDPEGRVHYLRIVVEPYRPGLSTARSPRRLVAAWGSSHHLARFGSPPGLRRCPPL